VEDKPLLEVSGLDVHYIDFQALRDVSLKIDQQNIVSIIGANGSGKSTLLNTIAGLFKPTQGSIDLNGEKISGLSAHQIVNCGISLVPEGRKVFSRLSVYDNLVMGSYTPKSRPQKGNNLERVYSLFPILKSRCHQRADTLSGGEQQMLSIGRALMSEPKLILCDEISLGLAPMIIKDIYSRVKQINRDGSTIILVEQDIKRSLKTADYVYVMLEGRIALEGKPSSLTMEMVKKAYFGL